MPIIRYTLRVGGEEDTFTETDILPAYPEATAEERIREIVVEPLNARRLLLSDPPLELVKTEVINPYVHEHSWTAGKRDTYALKQHYHCERCGITAYRPLNFISGPYGGMTRNPPFDKKKHYLCKDPLKQIPKTLVFG